MPTEADLQQYHSAALQMCMSLYENPYDVTPSGSQRWMFYAARMHEHRIMVEAMRMYGLAA